MKVLFDHNVPHKLRHSLVEHDVTTADEMGWAELENGELLTAGERAGFSVMLTADKNLSYQQNLAHRMLAIVVLSTNDWRTLRLDPGPVLDAINTAGPGTFQYVQLPQLP